MKSKMIGTNGLHNLKVRFKRLGSGSHEKWTQIKVKTHMVVKSDSNSKTKSSNSKHVISKTFNNKLSKASI